MLEYYTYCPRLLARRAEIKALYQLPAASKDITLPMIAAAPWPNAKHLIRTWEKIEEATSGRRYALDVDDSYVPRVPTKPAAIEFRELFSPTNGFENYYHQVEQLPNAIPVFRMAPGKEAVRAQLANVERLDRRLFVRLSNTGPAYASQTLDEIVSSDIEFVLFIDVGWGRDILSRQIWIHERIQQISKVATRVEVVVCSSSFPDSFADNGARSEYRFLERQIFSQISREFNEVRITYGDWGSTRPRQAPTPMNIVPRVDLPLSNAWLSFRKTKDEGYREIAGRIIDDPVWKEQPKIWGTTIIERTAQAQPGEIKNQEGAAAARINIHLHRQAQMNASKVVDDADEPFTDD